ARPPSPRGADGAGARRRARRAVLPRAAPRADRGRPGRRDRPRLRRGVPRRAGRGRGGDRVSGAGGAGGDRGRRAAGGGGAGGGRGRGAVLAEEPPRQRQPSSFRYTRRSATTVRSSWSSGPALNASTARMTRSTTAAGSVGP